MQRTHLGWEDTKNNVFCFRSDIRSESLGYESVYRSRNDTSVLASSFSEISLDMDMVDEGGSRDVRSVCL